MNSSFLKCLLPLCLIVACSSPKKATVTKSNINVVDSLKAHIAYLADDKLEGRRTGTPGEELAILVLRPSRDRAMAPAHLRSNQQVSLRGKQVGLSLVYLRPDGGIASGSPRLGSSVHRGDSNQ